MYSLHLNYTTTLPWKTVTMKITIFHVGTFLEHPNNWDIIGETWHLQEFLKWVHWLQRCCILS